MDKIVMMDDKPVTVSAIVTNPPSNSHIQFDMVVPYEWLHSYALENWKEDIDNQWVGGWPHTYVHINEASNVGQVAKLMNEVIARFSKKDWGRK